ncbi:MAG TPA: 3-dehydroquinate synthase [Syntrophales bacterium]|nr:3-dehydroquinate synthase [Syntrophales bacterium]HRT71775.1 3-dehydroquinate synthase [Syntrophales bacterium]
MNRIRVNLDKKVSKSYDICIGRAIMDRTALILAKNNWASRYVIITDSTVEELHGRRVLKIFDDANLKADMISFPAGESAKTLETGLRIAEKLLDLGVDRGSLVIALGGGVVGDLAGFVASVYMRGIPYVQIPTTLLAQVDSSIGGKTGVDLPAGKNFLGTFYQPKGVFIDLTFLETLPAREFGNGLAEIMKYGVIDDPELLEALEGGVDALRTDDTLLERVVARSCHIKKGIVEIDETEKGLRRVLNFGHTVGHAVEAESGYRMSHGESVAVGMAAAASISEKLKYLPAEDRGRIAALIRTIGLPDRLPQDMSTEGILSRIKNDKKKDGDTVHFVLLKKLGLPFMNGGVPEKLVREVIEEMKG